MLSQDELDDMMVQTRTSLSNFIYGMVRNAETAEELFQETWLRVVRNLESYDTAQPFKPWLFRIARNQCLNHLKQTKRRDQKDRTLAKEAHPPQLFHANISETKQDAEKVAGYLGELPLKFREILHLRFFEEMRLEDIAGVLNVPVGTVYSRVNRGLKHLRKRWEKQYEA